MTANGSTTRDGVREALASVEGTTTAAELAASLGVGRSTVGKALADLETKGLAERVPGGRDGAKRQPDGWAPAAGGSAGRSKAAAQPGRAAEQKPGDRLGRGQLRTAVVDYLEARRGEEVSPTQVAKALGRSAGAVSNALIKLTEEGRARQTSPQPRRFTAAT